MIDDGRSDISERERMNLLCSGYVSPSSLRYHPIPDTICQLPRLFMEHEEQQDIIWGRFCALYLPATVDRYINLPPNIGSDPFTASFKIHNPCSEMLVQVQHCPYFGKYLRSKKPIAANGKKLPRVVAERLIEYGPVWDEEMRTSSSTGKDNIKSILGSALQLLTTLCMAFVKEGNQDDVVPKNLRDGLVPLLETWERRYRGEFLANVSLRVLILWGPLMGSGLQEEVKKIRKQTLGWDECGLPGCRSRKDLKACSK